MSTKSLIHPDKDQLIAFGLGKLVLSEATEIESHLTECSDCCDTLLDLKDDTFIALVRESVELSVPNDNVGTDSSSPTVSLLSEGADGPDKLPRELADHPRYRIAELIGTGGMGVVFKAEHTLMNRTVALKIINHKLVRNADAVQRFRREVQAAARLTHPNIVTAYDAERAGNVHYLVMEYVDGTDLSDVVKQGSPLDVRQACDYVKQVADGLQHAHEKGMVHRDIKPHNLMVTAGGQIKILDFGLATLASSIEDETKQALADQNQQRMPAHHLTTFGTKMGTPDFISPEQAGDCRSVDIRSDIYSLGCTFYFLLTGRPPFIHGSVAEKVKAHVNEEPEPIENICSDIPVQLAHIIRRMMAKDPVERFQTPAEVAESLAPFNNGYHNEEDQSRSIAAQPQVSGNRWFPRAKTLIAAGMAGSLLVAAAVFFIQQQKTTVRFDVDDPHLAISFGSDSVTVKDDGRQFTIAPGTKQHFVVKQDGKELETDSFTLKKGQKVALRVQVVNGTVSVVPSDGSVSITKSVDQPTLTVDAWVERLKGLREHMQTAFAVGPELILLDPDKGLTIVRKAWPQITVAEVKTGLLKAFAFSKTLHPQKHPKVLHVLHLGMTDPNPEINVYAASYAEEYAMEDFSGSAERYATWYREYGNKSPEEIIQLNQSRVPQILTDKLNELEDAMRKGELKTVATLAAKLGETSHPIVIPTLIGVIDADNSYDTIYGVGYFGLGRMTKVDYSPYHDGAWWRRWWTKNKTHFPKEVQQVEIPEFPKTEHGRTHQPFPEDLDTLGGKLRHFKLLSGEPRSSIWNWATEIAKHKDPSAIPFLIGVIDADNTYDTVYGVGYYGLGKLTGVEYDENHNGAWWRKWWEENKSKYSAEVQAIAIPDLHADVATWKAARPESSSKDPLTDVADIPAKDLHIGNNDNMRYFLIGPRKEAAAPTNGFKLVIVLPGGDGGENFHPFIRRLYKNGMSNDFLVAQPIAFKWRPNQEIVWPTRTNSVEGQEFGTEDFVEAVIRDVGGQYPLDKESIFTLSWSSSGPAAYAIALSKDSPVTGSYIAMSVFKPEALPPLEMARGRAFLIEHSPDDQVCPFGMAEQAKESLEKHGAKVRFNTYEGGHGWHGDIYGRVRRGVEWMQQHAAQDK